MRSLSGRVKDIGETRLGSDCEAVNDRLGFIPLFLQFLKQKRTSRLKTNSRSGARGRKGCGSRRSFIRPYSAFEINRRKDRDREFEIRASQRKSPATFTFFLFPHAERIRK